MRNTCFSSESLEFWRAEYLHDLVPPYPSLSLPRKKHHLDLVFFKQTSWTETLCCVIASQSHSLCLFRENIGSLHMDSSRLCLLSVPVIDPAVYLCCVTMINKTVSVTTCLVLWNLLWTNWMHVWSWDGQSKHIWSGHTAMLFVPHFIYISYTNSQWSFARESITQSRTWYEESTAQTLCQHNKNNFLPR